jgi:hypothetical protein
MDQIWKCNIKNKSNNSSTYNFSKPLVGIALRQYGLLGTSAITQNKHSNQADSSKLPLFLRTWLRNSE